MKKSAIWTVEQLEQRTLLSGSPFSVSNLSHFTPTSSDINDVKNGPLAAAGQHLADLYSEYKTYLKKGGNRSAFVSKDEPLLDYNGTSVNVTLRTLASMNNTTQFLHGLGAQLIDRDSTYGVVDAYIPISQLSTVMANSMIVSANPNFAPQTFTQGVANNQGDGAENADSARTTFGVDGTGVKVGVISDSVNEFEGGLADSVATHDLPKGVHIIEDFEDAAGTTTLPADVSDLMDDEGRAMLEEIHDIAPGAQLYFATSGLSQETMARNIEELQRAGCNIIVDDVGFADEPMFQQGIIDQAITDVVENHGVTYISAAGNSSTAGFGTDDANWVQNAAHQTLLDFDPSDNVNTRMSVTVTGVSTITLEWEAPFNGVAGSVDVDLDIQFIDPLTGEIVAQGNTDNLYTQTPVEIVDPPAGTWDVQISVANEVPGATLPSAIRLTSANGGSGLPEISDIQYPLSRATIQGHSGGQDVISVAAVPWYLAPAYNSTQKVTTEDFSAFGPVQYYYTSNGVARAKPVTLLKPDVSGIDGVNTSFFGYDITQDSDKLPNFSGTSAAAPNVAAVAALMLQLDPTATPTDIENALIASAKQNPVNGQTPGSYDPQAGYGLIDALQAMHALEPTMPVPAFTRVVPNSVATGIKSLTVTFDEPVTGLDLSDFTLTRGKGSTTNLMPEDATLTTTDNTTYTISGLRGATKRRGTYTLTLAPDAATDSGGNSTLGGATSFIVTGKPTDVVAIPTDQNQVTIDWTDNTTNEIGFDVVRALDAGFTDQVQTFHVKANVTQYKDNTVAAGTQYYYKVVAEIDDNAGDPASATVAVFTTTTGETIIDNRSESGAAFAGDWSLVADPTDSYGGDYMSDGNSGKGTKIATFMPTLPATGQYYVYVYSDTGKSHSTQVPVTVNSLKGASTTTINEKSSSGWILLGQFSFESGRHGSVTISNAGTKGIVIADAVRFQATGVLPTSTPASKASSAISIFGTESIDNKKDSVLD